MKIVLHITEFPSVSERSLSIVIIHWNFQEYSVNILNAIIDRVCLGLPELCIVGYSSTFSIGF